MVDDVEVQAGRELSGLWWLPLLRGIVLLALGGLMLAHPLETVTGLVWLFGIFAVVDGVLVVVQALVERAKAAMWWQILGGLAIVALGVVILVWPQPTVAVLFYLVVAWVLVLGGFGVVAAVVLHGRDETTWYFALAFGLVNLVIGLLLAFNPQTSLTVVMVLVGAFALVGGVLLIVSSFAVRSAGKRLAAA